MPIPTDTFWNIKRLNWIFAISGVLLLLITVGSVLQDYNKDWRQPQRDAIAWELAMVEEKIDRETTDEKRARLADLEQQIARYEQTIGTGNEETAKLRQHIRELESEKSTIEFALNLDKAELTVAEGQLQDAIAADDEARVGEINQKLQPLRHGVAQQSEAIAAKNDEITAAKQELAERTAALEEVRREYALMSGDVEMLRKKLVSLDPSEQGGVQGLVGTISTQVRRAPLAQFINPAEKVQQIVLPDIRTNLGGFKLVESIDRCTTCHVNIAKRDFTEENVLKFLEEQVASARRYALPEEWSGKAADPVATIAAPGPVALPEFWQSWTVQVAPAALGRNKARLGNITKIVGSGAIVTIDGEPLEQFTYDPETTDDEVARRQEGVLIQLIETLLAYTPPAEGQVYSSASPQGVQPEVLIEILGNADAKILAAARLNAMRYVEELAKSVRESLDAEKQDQLEERYRYALTEALNGFRKQQDREALDPSPVLLAHPNLDLYVDVDSKHPFESVGCTSCHDGSGMETDFVLAAHVAKPIWVDRTTGEPVLPAQLRPSKPIGQPHHAPDLSSMLAAVYPEGSPIPEQVSKLHFTLGESGEAAAHVEASPAEPSANAEHPEAPMPIDEAPEDADPVVYVDPVTGKTGRAVSQMRHWREVYEPRAPRSFALVYHEWDRPMLPSQYLQANCVRCHTESYDIANFAPVVHRGRTLYKKMGCVNCHQMNSIAGEAVPPTESHVNLIMSNGQRKVGTDLRQVTAKLSPEMINTWIWAPKAFRPSTRMPHFFMLENNSSDEEIRRTKQEARAITEYLVQTATPQPPMHVIQPGMQGSAEAGKTLFNSIGCMACHTNLGDATGATRKTAGGTKPVTVAEEWIVNDLIESGRLAQEIAEQTGATPSRNDLKAEAEKRFDAMSYNERQLYVSENLGVEGTLDERPTYPSGKPKPMFVNHGPELSGVGTKLLAGRSEDDARQWLYDWLMEPRHYSEYTVMPNLRLEPQQAMDLTEYLLAQRRTNDHPDDTWRPGMTGPDTAKLIELTAMFLRSRFSENQARVKADEDGEVLALAADALVTADTDIEAAKVKAEQLTKDQQRMVFLGKKLISHYGCMSCHAINGTETFSAPGTNLSDWGQKGIDKLDFAYLDHHKHVGPHALPETTEVPLVNGLSPDATHLLEGSSSGATPSSAAVNVAWPHLAHNRTAWITQKLKNTRIYDRGKALLEPQPGTDNHGRPYDKLKMPTFYLSDAEVDALVTFVISNRDRLISDTLHNRTIHEQARQVAQGRMLAEKYNCVGCHQIEHNLPPVQQYYKQDEITTKAPPSLRGEGNKVQHDWLFNFLKDVEPLRPLPVIRMPSFPILDEEATAIAAYFHAVSEKESNELRRVLDPVVKYVESTNAASTEPLYTESAWPGDDWYRRPEFARAADRLAQWGLENGQITPLQLDPTKYTPEEMGRNYRTLLFKARFTERLYDSPYPFTDSPRPLIADERFKRGESLFYEMQCLKCHFMGDPSAPGAAQNPTAPNLALAHKRLQRRWVRHWVQEPAVIQTGTAMPPFLTGLSIYDQDGMAWPRSQGQSGDEALRVESLYGANPNDQANLLLDFLFAAGARNHTAVQPQQTGALAGVEPIHQPATQPVYEHDGVAVIIGQAPEKPAEVAVTPTDAPAEAAPAAPQGAPVTGKVMFTGPVPEVGTIDMSGVAECAALHADEISDPSIKVSASGELQDVIVWIDGIEGTFAPPSEPAKLDQQGCMYVPHVLALQTGQPLVVANSDPFLHNVHALATDNPAFNFGQPNVDPGRNVGSMRVPESFRVKCDVHPWMSAYIRVFEHPFFAVSKADGSFSIANVPTGTYTLRAWHERFGTLDKQVTISAGEPLQVDLSFSQGSAMLDAARRAVPWAMEELAGVQLASAGGATTSCPHCKPVGAQTEQQIAKSQD